jgi:hypothetical protein
MHPFALFTRSCLIASVMAVASVGGAKAFVSSSPDPFPPGSGFVQSPGCLTSGVLSGLCASDVTGLILSSSSKFAGSDQEFVLDERVTGEISFEGTPIGDFSVQGDLDLTLDHRTSDSQTGTFHGVVTFEDYKGLFDGLPVEFTLYPPEKSTVEVMITAFSNPGSNTLSFQIDSSFDLFSQISIEGGAPIPVGGFPIIGVAAVPEPPTGVLLALPMLVLGLVRWRAKA